jgi:asparaginyl-tRNA synthetase
MEKISVHSARRPEAIGGNVRLQGWVRTRRDSKGGFSFLELNDGSSLANLQIIAPAELANYETEVKHLTAGCSVTVEGEVKASGGKGQATEVLAAKIVLHGGADPEAYPLQKKQHSFEKLREWAHLRPRTNTFGAIARVRNCVCRSIHNFFQEEGFLYVHTPIITASDCEGAGQMFRVTTLDLAKPEMAFFELSDNMDLAERFLKRIFRDVLAQCPEDMQFFNERIDTTTLETLQQIVESQFVRLSYTEAVEILEKSGQTFEFPVSWGTDLQSEHERYLTEQKFKCPVILYDYPRQIKSFYMRLSDDGRTVRAMDVLVPKVGEIIGGSQREERLDVLTTRMTELELDPAGYWWYLDLRRFGTVPHSGFGLGLERAVQFITGMANIRDVIPFPRAPGSAEF